jgi:hypothetical protein
MDAQGTRSQCTTLVDALVPTHAPHTNVPWLCPPSPIEAVISTA